MINNRIITIRLTGLEEDNGDVRLNEFVQALENLKKALSETTKITVSNTEIVYFKVIKLQKNSPSLVSVEAVPTKEEFENETDLLVKSFFKNINDINFGRYPENFSHETFVAYKDLVSLQRKNKIKEISISSNGENEVSLDGFSKKIEDIMGQDEFEIGSYTGMLDAINIHNQNVFFIYPPSRRTKMRCIFSLDMKSQAINALGKYVTVTGTKRYLSNLKDAEPLEIKVKRIEIHPDESVIPNLSDLRGIAPDITKNQSSEDFIRGLRDVW